MGGRRSCGCSMPALAAPESPARLRLCRRAPGCFSPIDPGRRSMAERVLQRPRTPQLVHATASRWRDAAMSFIGRLHRHRPPPLTGALASKRQASSSVSARVTDYVEFTSSAESRLALGRRTRGPDADVPRRGGFVSLVGRPDSLAVRRPRPGAGGGSTATGRGYRLGGSTPYCVSERLADALRAASSLSFVGGVAGRRPK